MNKTITKKQVIKAINTEPLAGGQWVEYTAEPKDMLYTFPNKGSNCKVCAVGAVLRHAKFKNLEIYRFGNEMLDYGPVGRCTLNAIATEIKNQLKEKNYLHALSLKFEYQAPKTGVGKRTRKILTDFVEKYFPNKIKLDPQF